MTDSVEKEPQPTPDEERRPGLLQSDAANVVTLVRICGGVVAAWRQGEHVMCRRCAQPAPRPGPRGAAQAVPFRAR